MGLLDSVLGRTSAGGGGMSPLTMALIGLLAYRTFHGQGRLAEMLGRTAPGQAPAQPGQTLAQTASAGGGLGGLLSSFLGGSGSTGGILSNGLGDLLRQFQSSGQGDKMQSWIGNGTNQPIGPSELENAVGSDKIDWLSRETGIPRDQLLSGLSRELPNLVDKLTPHGRIPSEPEAARMT